MTHLRDAASSPAATVSSSTQIPMVTQQLLARHQELSLAMAPLARERKAIQTQLKILLAAGVPVEPGGLTASLRASESRPLNLRTLRQFFQPEDIAWMKSQVQPVSTQRLVIGETPSYTPIVVDAIIGGLPRQSDVR